MQNRFYLKNSLRGALRFVMGAGMLLLFSSLYVGLWPGSGRLLPGLVYLITAGLFVGGLEGFRFGEKRPFDLTLAQWLGLLLAGGLSWLQLCLVKGGFVSPLPMIALVLFQGLLALGLTRLFCKGFGKLFRPYRTALVCDPSVEDTIREKLLTRRDKYRLDQLVSADMPLEDLFLSLEGCEATVLCGVQEPLRSELLKHCYRKGIRVYVVPELSDLLLRFGKTVTAFDTPMLLVRSGGLTPRQRLCKRVLDLALVLLALIPAAPVMALTALAIRLEDGGPVFYRQKRLTQGGREFEILKFRSMIPDAEKHSGAVLASQNDPRITRVGRFIRATRLDELPQLLNILKGDMSIVGPRPERREIADRYCRELPEFDCRLKVPGGLTGYAQVYGKYNTTPADKLRLDLIYMENYSLLLDIRLILLTLRILFTKESTEGVAQKEEAKCS